MEIRFTLLRQTPQTTFFYMQEVYFITGKQAGCLEFSFSGNVQNNTQTKNDEIYGYIFTVS